jgi:hypothetical protein
MASAKLIISFNCVYADLSLVVRSIPGKYSLRAFFISLSVVCYGL